MHSSRKRHSILTFYDLPSPPIPNSSPRPINFGLQTISFAQYDFSPPKGSPKENDPIALYHRLVEFYRRWPRHTQILFSHALISFKSPGAQLGSLVFGFLKKSHFLAEIRANPSVTVTMKLFFHYIATHSSSGKHSCVSILFPAIPWNILKGEALTSPRESGVSLPFHSHGRKRGNTL